MFVFYQPNYIEPLAICDWNRSGIIENQLQNLELHDSHAPNQSQKPTFRCGWSRELRSGPDLIFLEGKPT